MVKDKFRVAEDGMLLFWCTGCNNYHGVYVDQEQPIHWEFNGDYNKPTLAPSVLITNTQGLRCHSFIRDGKIQYLSDRSHKLAGQIVDLKSE